MKRKRNAPSHPTPSSTEPTPELTQPALPTAPTAPAVNAASLRHHLIPGDTRFTFEGLLWSWRLKGDYYRTQPCEITVVDPSADLASVPAKFFGRNRWILDLQTPRIPKDALASPPN